MRITANQEVFGCAVPIEIKKIKNKLQKNTSEIQSLTVRIRNIYNKPSPTTNPPEI